MERSLIGPLTTVVLLLVALGVVAWMLKRSPLARTAGTRGGQSAVPMNLLGMLALSPQQRIIAVEVGAGASRQWLVLGVSPQSIQTLTTIAQPESGSQADIGDALNAAAATPAAPGFGAALNRALGR